MTRRRLVALLVLPVVFALAACGGTVTPLGEESGWGDPDEQVLEDGLCRFGNFVEDVDR